jgi:hypothetical protein
MAGLDELEEHSQSLDESEASRQAQNISNMAVFAGDQLHVPSPSYGRVMDGEIVGDVPVLSPLAKPLHGERCW